MKFEFGSRSKSVLKEAIPSLSEILREALSLGLIDISCIESFRDKERQDTLFFEEKSRVQWPNGKHNQYPSKAIDAAPYVKGKVSYDWKHCIYLAGIICAIARMKGVNLRWGGNWDMDAEPITDQDFQDLVHYEIVGG